MRLVLLVALFLLATASGQAPQSEGEPEILPEEVLAPEADWRDGGGDPPYPWYQPPANETGDVR